MIASRAARAALARDALMLRRRLLALLAAPDSTAARGALAVASAETWRFLLGAECCALPIGAFLRARRLESALETDVRNALHAAELRETQRILAARTTLDVLDEIGASCGISLVALKGAALAAAPNATALDLGDVDILVSRDGAERVWRLLTERGWKPSANAITPATVTDENHLEALLPPGVGLPVELHQQVHYGERRTRTDAREPIAGRASLMRLQGCDAALVLLRHSVAAHPHRRGHLRDLFLLATVLRDLTADDRAMLDAAIVQDGFAPEMQEMLETAATFERNAGSIPSVRTERFVAWKYATLLRVDWVVREMIPGWLSVNHIPLERRAVRRSAIATQLRGAVGAVPLASGFRFGRSSPRIAPHALLAWLARASWRLGLLALLGIVGWRVPRVVENLIPRGDGSLDGHRTRGTASRRHA